MSTKTEMLSAGRGAGSGDPGATTNVVARLRGEAPWWLLPVTVVTVLGVFIVYTVIIATTGEGDALNKGAPYLSPFYSPGWLAGVVPVFPALLCLLVPVGFRTTCYYYRKAYHRSFLWDPPACAMKELRHRTYHGETRLPWVLNNLHRFAMYLALIYIVLLAYDGVNAFSYGGHLYLGLGTLIMVVNVVLLAGYTLSCHSLRHFVGGNLDCYSRSSVTRVRHGLWRQVSRINVYHPTWAWLSLFSVWGTDVYIRMLHGGWIVDPHHLF